MNSNNYLFSYKFIVSRINVICSTDVVAFIPPGKRVYFHWELGLTQIPPITRLPHLLPPRRTGGNYKGLKYIMSVLREKKPSL